MDPKELTVLSPFGGTYTPLSLDGSSAEFPDIKDVDYVIHQGEEEEDGDWDGTAAAVLKLKDGRYMVWEAWWGPTGDSFNEDAYGGDGDVSFARDYYQAVMFGLTDEGRKILNLDLDDLMRQIKDPRFDFENPPAPWTKEGVQSIIEELLP